MRMYLEKDREVTPALLAKIMRRWSTETLPELRFHQGYYDGTGQAIMKRTYEDPTKPQNRIVKNYCKSIVENFRGYITGIPITYSSIEDQDITPLLDVLKDNDIVNQDSVWLRNALVYGSAPLLCYVNEYNQKRFKTILPTQVIPVYTADLDEELMLVIYFYPTVDWDSDKWETKYSVNVYDNENIYHFTCDQSFNSLIPSGDPEAHHFGEVPFVIFDLNEDQASIFKPIISLQDAYNSLLSDEVNDFETFVDAYLVLKNMTASGEDIADMKETRTLLLDDDSDAFYLTKDISDTQIQNLLENLNSSIHTISNSPDFSSEEFNQGVSSGVALKFKLVGFNNVAASIESHFRKAIEWRNWLINRLFSLVDTEVYPCEVTFNPNLPQNIADTVNMVNSLRGLVSDKTLLEQIPFVKDPDQEIAAMAAPDLYDFGE